MAMNNTDVDRILQDCDAELTSIGNAMSNSSFAPINQYLTMYALIKSCSTVERGYKKIVADYYKLRCPDVASYLENKVMNSSTNPTYESICKLIKDFNDQAEATFKQNMQALANYNKIVAQLGSLVTNRNNFAHGQTVTCSFTDIVDYYTCAKEVLICMDNIIR